MKKFYLLTTVIFFAFVNVGLAQFAASNTGNWSNPITWAPGAIPSASCGNGCTITIKPNVTVTMDAEVILSGNAKLFIGTDAINPAKLVIPFSNNVLANPHNRVIMTYNDPVVIQLANANATVDASTAGIYDGVIIRVPFPTLTPPYMDFQRVGPNSLWNQPTISGPSTLSSTGVLPITLSRFDAILNNKVINLSWTTAEEINSDHFGIERSTDASHWQTIGKVAAAGFSSIAVNYSYTDESPSVGVNYYRLQMVDGDGKYKYSSVKVVNGTLTKGLSVFPNPANNFVNVTLGNEMNLGTTIRLINQFGQILQERKLNHAAGTTISLPVHNYPQGSYVLQVIGEDGSRQTSKVLISR